MTEIVKNAGDREMEVEEQNEDGVTETFESRRLQLLRAVIENIVQKAAYSVSFEKIKEIAMNVSVDHVLNRQQENSLTHFYSKYQRMLENVMKKDVDDYLSKSRLKEVFDKMSEMFTENNSASFSKWRPTGNPCQDMRSHEAENHIQHNELLQGLIAEQEAEIQTLKHDLFHRRLQVHNLMKKMAYLQEDCGVIHAKDSTLLLCISNLANELTG